MRGSLSPTATGYFIAVVATAVLVLLRLALDDWFGSDAPLLGLIVAVVAAAWIGGWKPGILATLISVVPGIYLFIEPRYTFALSKTSDWVRVGVFLIAGALVSGLFETLHSYRRRLQRKLDLLNNCYDAVLSWELGGAICSWNQGAEQLYGYTRTEALGRKCVELLGEPVKGIEDALRRDGRWTGELTHTIRGGTVAVECRMVLVREEDGKQLVLATNRDITNHRQAEVDLKRSNEFHAAIAALTTDFAFIARIEPDGKVIPEAVTEGFSKLLGYSMEEMMALGGWVVLVHPDHLKQASAEMRRLMVGEAIEGQMKHVAKDGRILWLHYQTHPVMVGGQAVRLYGAAQDITARKEAEEALRESEERLRLATEAGGMSTWDWVIGSEFVSWSPSHFTLFGYPPSPDGRATFEMWRARVHPDDLKQVLAALEEARQTRSLYSLDYRVVQPEQGRVVWVEAFGRFLYENDRPIRFVGVLFDITQRKQVQAALARSESQFRQLADSMPQVVWTARPDGHIDYYNERWYEYTGFARGEYSESHWAAILHPDDVEPTKDAFYGALREERPYQMEYRWKDRERGGYRWFLGRALPVRDESGQIVRWFGTCTDIDDVKRLQQEAREADRRKDEFLATLSHELRNPLVPIRNALQVLQKHGPREPNLQVARDLIGRQVDQLVRLIDDLLDVSRITLGKMNLRAQRVELAAVIRDAVEATQPLIESSGHRLTLTLPPAPVFLDADPVRLAQVFANLLNNATKYTDPGGNITLTAELPAPRPRETAEVVVVVKDNGIGIPPEHLPRLFDKFSQVTSALERSQGGLGLGLSLVRGLVEMHGGRVAAHSQGPGMGSEFVVHLPLPSRPAVDHPPEPARGGGQSVPGRRILVVDDNHDSALSLALLLRLTGNEVQTAHDGLEAVAAAEQFRPDVVLMDIGMPRLNGYDACRRIREQPWGKSMVLIAQTGWASERDRRRSEEAGFDDHLLKPVEPDVLLTRLASVARI